MARRRLWRMLDSYILQEMAGPLLFGILAFTVLFVAGGILFDVADLIIERGVSLWVVTRLFLYRLPEVVGTILPMAALLSALLSFSTMSAQSEIVALKASGISFQRIVRPVIIVAVLLSMLCFLWNESVVPLSYRAAENLMNAEVRNQRPSLIKERIFLRQEEEGELKRVMYVEKLKPRVGTMERILIQEFDGGRLRRILQAKKGSWDGSVWRLRQGKVYQVSPEGTVSLMLTFETQEIPLRLSPEQLERSSRDPDKMGIAQLINEIAIVSAKGGSTRKLFVYLHMRIAFPWAAVVLALVGATLGVRSHRGGTGIGLGLSILVAFAYYVVMSFSRAFALAGFIPAAVGAWTPFVLFLLLGGFLAKRANR
ncbi:MAG: LptF/LptG family permease [Synergistales bacterium]|nr:LptF/LptG family permease [Synergistales bacterium]